MNEVNFIYDRIVSVKKVNLKTFDLKKFLKNVYSTQHTYRRVEAIINSSINEKYQENKYLFSPYKLFNTKLSVPNKFISGKIFSTLHKSFKYFPIITIYTQDLTKSQNKSYYYKSFGLLYISKNKDFFLIKNVQDNKNFHTDNHFKFSHWNCLSSKVFSSWIIKIYNKKTDTKDIFGWVIDYFLKQTHKNTHPGHDIHMGGGNIHCITQQQPKGQL